MGDPSLRLKYGFVRDDAFGKWGIVFFLFRPSEARVRAFLAEQQRAGKFSYLELGATRGELPQAYAVLRGRVDLGFGSARFDRAMQAVRQWKMFAVPGVQLCWPDSPIREGETVAIVIRHVGFWSLNCCRIVYVIDEAGPVRRFGFAYGTLMEHGESGEERFLVEWDRVSDVVSYDILSFSRAGNLLVRIALPLARWLQRRFIYYSLEAMAE